MAKTTWDKVKKTVGDSVKYDIGLADKFGQGIGTIDNTIGEGINNASNFVLGSRATDSLKAGAGKLVRGIVNNKAKQYAKGAMKTAPMPKKLLKNLPVNTPSSMPPIPNNNMAAPRRTNVVGNGLGISNRPITGGSNYNPQQ